MPTQYSCAVTNPSLDSIDRALLRLVQENANLTLEELGEAIGLSGPAVQRRLRKHDDAGRIAGTVTLLEPASVGVPILVLTMVVLERDTAPAIEAFRKQIQDHPNVQQCYDLAGNFDLAMFLAVPDMETYRDVTAEILDGNTNVRRYASHVTLRTLKRTLQVPC